MAPTHLGEPRSVLPPNGAATSSLPRPYGAGVTEPDDIFDEDSAAANRADIRRATIITIIALVAVILASMLIVVGGFPA